MACQISPRTTLIQCEKLKDLGGLFDTSGTKVSLRLKLRDVFGYFAFTNLPKFTKEVGLPGSKAVVLMGCL
jgi:hypothetical protein